MKKKNIDQVKSKIVKILKKHGIVKAGIFGSYAKGKETKNSDIDILIEVNDKNFTLLDLAKLKLLIEDTLNKKVDLVEYSMLHPLIKKNALNEEVKIL